eukprot:5812343-Prymnesium_polylepis.1
MMQPVAAQTRSTSAPTARLARWRFGSALRYYLRQPARPSATEDKNPLATQRAKAISLRVALASRPDTLMSSAKRASL